MFPQRTFQRSMAHWQILPNIKEIQFTSVAQSCPTFCYPMDSSTPGFPVHHQLPELAQTHVLWVSDAIQPSHPLLSPSSRPFNLSALGSFPVSQFFAWGGQTGVRWIFRTDFLQDGLVWFPCSPRDSQESSPTPQFSSSAFILSGKIHLYFALSLTCII